MDFLFFFLLVILLLLLHDSKKRKPEIAVGIDLGTKYSRVGVYRDGRLEIVAEEETPSVVAFGDKERLVGSAAIELASRSPSQCVFDTKRLIGRKCSDPSVQSDAELWPFKVVAGPDDKPMIVVRYKGKEKRVCAEEISARLLKKLRQDAEAYLGSTVKDAVLTVPASFSDSQRGATMEAARIAGLNVLRLVNEPTAAAIAYSHDKKSGYVGPKNLLIFNLGGGALDVSLITVKNGVYKVMGTAGNAHLGGEDLDNTLVNYFARKFKDKHEVDIRGNPVALAKLRFACERAKRRLSSASDAKIKIDDLHGGNSFHSTLTRATFEDLNESFFSECLDSVELCLRIAQMDKCNVDEVVLVGGSSRIPKVEELLQGFFSGKELCKDINRDKAVAYGAAIQAAMLSGNGGENVRNFALRDVTPRSIGFETSGGSVTALIPRNTHIPVRKEHLLSIKPDERGEAMVRIYEGESTRSSENNLLGEFKIRGPKGFPQVCIILDVDANGVLKVSSKKEKLKDSSGRPLVPEGRGLSKAETKGVDKSLKSLPLATANGFKVMNPLTTTGFQAGEMQVGWPLEVKETVEIRLENHPHTMKLVSCQAPFYCSGCGQVGFKSFYQCSEGGCYHKRHQECAQPQSNIQHPFFKNCHFKFHEESPESGRVCDACGLDVRGFVYRCTHDEAHDLHPCCVKLDQRILGYGFTLELRRKISSTCLKCGAKETLSGIRGWSYESSDGIYCFHVACVRELIFDKWERSRRDGGSIVLELGDLESHTIIPRRARESSSIGKKVKFSLKVAITVLKLVIGSILGNPFSAIHAVAEAGIFSGC